jgi:hypothetical protein
MHESWLGFLILAILIFAVWYYDTQDDRRREQEYDSQIAQLLAGYNTAYEAANAAKAAAYSAQLDAYYARRNAFRNARRHAWRWRDKRGRGRRD